MKVELRLAEKKVTQKVKTQQSPGLNQDLVDKKNQTSYQLPQPRRNVKVAYLMLNFSKIGAIASENPSTANFEAV